MKKIACIFLIFFSCFLSIFAQEKTVGELNDLAVEYYKSGAFDKAIDCYKSILGENGESAEVYYNLGNAYYKKNDVAHSILYYERALLLDPSMKDASHNLILANARTQDKIDEIPTFFLTSWWNALSSLADTDTWARCSLIFFFVFIICVFVYFFSKKVIARKVGFYTGLLMLFLCINVYFLANTQKNKLEERNFAIVMSPSVTVNSTPDEQGTKLFVLHEGVKVKIISTLGLWVEIKLSDGSIGWLKSSDIEII